MPGPKRYFLLELIVPLNEYVMNGETALLLT